MKRIAIIFLVAIVGLAAYPSWLGFQVWRQSHRDELHSADAIVVLGAAQYDGRPSPVFAARLDHGLYLFEEGFSDLIIVTGGSRPGDRFTEAQAAVLYLGARGVGPDHLAGEGRGTTTLESLRGVREIAGARGVESLLLVSDPLHSERIKRIARDLGFEAVYTSPASYERLRRTRRTKARQLLREVGSLILYELFGR